MTTTKELHTNLSRSETHEAHPPLIFVPANQPRMKTNETLDRFHLAPRFTLWIFAFQIDGQASGRCPPYVRSGLDLSLIQWGYGGIF